VSNAAVPFTNVNGDHFSGQINLGMYQVLSNQVSAPWPVPLPAGDTDTAASLAALTWISKQVCQCDDIRTQYWDSDAIDKYIKDVAGVPYTPGQGFNQDEFTAVQDWLANTELPDVQAVDGLRDNMTTALQNAGIGTDSKLTDAYNAVSANIEVSNSGATVFSIIADVLSTIASFPLPEEGAVESLGVVSALLVNAADFATTTGGATLDDLSTTVGQLEHKAEAAFEAANANLAQTFYLITGNWGRLQEVADGLAKYKDLWPIDPGTTATNMLNVLELGFYRALIPVAYQAEEGFAVRSPSPGDWCEPTKVKVADPGLCPFKAYDSGTSAYSFSVNDPASDWAPANDLEVVGTYPHGKAIMWSKGTNLTCGGHSTELCVGDPFPASLMKTLTGLGLYPAYLFERWPLSHWLCPADDVECSAAS
jgi:hypothetical protein